jgi:hypothetical protein
MKILAMYLPQYHQINENDLWWGEGYTEWEAVKNAKPLFHNHYQPKVPLDNRYYDLSEKDAKTWKWQAELARYYGVFGFCIYHYWFKDNKQLLEKPMQILLNHKEIDINYCICWANEDWTRTWYGLEKEILISQEYGEIKDWIYHFNYLLPFFKDDRYIKVNNKPVICIHRSSKISVLKDMTNCWNKLAIDNGYNGVYIIVANTGGELETRVDLIDAYYNFEPGYTLNHKIPFINRFILDISIFFRMLYNRLFHKNVIERVVDCKLIYKYMDSSIKCNKPIFRGTFPMWDNTPRRSYKGLYYKNSSCEAFCQSLLTIKKCINQDDFVFINAWNEWGEGCYLEPDNLNGHSYLETIKKIIDAK